MDIKEILTDSPTEKIVPGFGPMTSDVLILGTQPSSLAYKHPIQNVLMPHAAIDPSLCRFESVMQENGMKPSKEQTIRYGHAVMGRINEIKPRIIIALGKVAMLALGIKGPLSVLHGTSTKIIAGVQQYTVYSMYDPDAAQLNPDIMPSLISDWKQLGRDLNELTTREVDPVDVALEEEGWTVAPKALRLTTA